MAVFHLLDLFMFKPMRVSTIFFKQNIQYVSAEDHVDVITLKSRSKSFCVLLVWHVFSLPLGLTRKNFPCGWARNIDSDFVGQRCWLGDDPFLLGRVIFRGQPLVLGRLHFEQPKNWTSCNGFQHVSHPASQAECLHESYGRHYFLKKQMFVQNPHSHHTGIKCL